MKRVHSRRVRITVSLSADLVRRLDQGRRKGIPRSRLLEEWIEDRDKLRRQRELEEEVRAYYAVPPTKEEKEMSKALHRLASKALVRSEREGW